MLPTRRSSPRALQVCGRECPYTASQSHFGSQTHTCTSEHRRKEVDLESSTQTVECIHSYMYPGLLLHTELMVSLFIRCTMRCEIWAQPAELPR